SALRKVAPFDPCAGELQLKVQRATMRCRSARSGSEFGAMFQNFNRGLIFAQAEQEPTKLEIEIFKKHEPGLVLRVINIRGFHLLHEAMRRRFRFDVVKWGMKLAE